ncbi:molybdate ABC transporter substrate-binding protein [Vreelandella malpeensis]|uniref:Molybdate ABC transporter substrate-binding protein n=1 Tax=Vreelandella malpeensis TaxID=1172368 RepID=A0ABS8DN45_9GAMM|nr:molybdate ABC transporter substrate-binding protein [Halomonas malpeensis]MCB8887732.1 molybdate ABC transporter substrate-binding protein [Halomonas malpeensis]
MNRFPFRPLAAALCLALSPGVLAADRVQVAAAASLTDALNEVIEVFETEHDIEIVPVYASSSTLARQIASGSPAQLFVSANVDWMDWLEDEGVDVQARRDLLQNRLALVSASDSLPARFTPGDGEPIASLMGDDDRLSVGDPDHVPAGIYTQQALEALGEWKALEARLARGNDVRAALALVERGETPAGVVYQTDAFASPAVRVLGLFPADSHDPITYPAALIDADDNAAAQTFREWLESDAALDIFEAYGFDTSVSRP